MRRNRRPQRRLSFLRIGVTAVALLMVGGLLSPVTALADEATDAASWDFTSGTAETGVLDASWNGHDGAPGLGVSFDTEIGAVFDGTNDGEIIVSEKTDDLQPNAATAGDTWRLDLSGVVPAVVDRKHRVIVGSRDADKVGWAVYITDANKFEFWAAQSGAGQAFGKAASNVVAQVGKSYDIAVSKEGNKISISVTGAAAGDGSTTLAGSFVPPSSGAALYFGNGNIDGSGFFYSGSISSARISITEGDDETPVDPTHPVTIPKIEYPLTDSEYESAAAAAFARTTGDVANQVSFEMVRSDASEENFTISGTEGNISIVASTPSALTAGAGWYLKYVANAAVNLGNAYPELPEVLPAPAQPITKTGHEAYRFAFNDTQEAYTDPYLDWDGWQRLLDNLALHGINQVFLTVGTDAVYAELLTEYGYSDAEARAWIPQPAHQPWWVLQNISSEDQEPMTPAALENRAELASKIVERAEQLGIMPVLPGYFGTVPVDFDERNPGANVIPQGTWSNYQTPSWLDPTSEEFSSVAADYYRISSELIGDAGVYKMDPLHEGGRPGDVSVTDAATGIETALRAAHPKALWSLLGWQSNPSSALLNGVQDKSRLLIVDGLSDTVSSLDRETKWPGVPYAFGSIYNFGGNTSMGAISGVWLDRYFAAREKEGSSMNGVAILPEGFYNNPAAYELMSELPWMDSAPDQTRWFQDYAKGRYGTDAAAEAWETISKTAYSMEPIGTHSESHDGLFSAQPSLTTTKARACCARGVVRYDMAAFAAALPQLLEADDSVVQRDAYEYDVTDVTRQVIVNVARDLLPEIKAAYDAGDAEEFDELTGTWMDLIAQLDDVLGTQEDFLLGAYVERAKAQNGAIGTYDLQNLLTAWGTKQSFSLHDYANREWQGLVGDFYASRWELYFDGLRSALAGGTAPSVDWFTFDEDWAKKDHGYPSTPSGDVVAEAQDVVKFLGEGEAKITLDAPSIRPGAVSTVIATIQNTSPIGTIDSAELTLQAPDGITVEQPSVRLESIKAGEKRTATWSVSADDFPQAIAQLSIDSEVTVGADVRQETTSASVLVGSAAASPWKLYSTEPDAEFAFAGDQIGLRTTGRDFSRGNRYFSTAYQQNVLSDGDVVTVHVDLQESEGSRPWARTGLLVSPGAATANSPMAVLALTPGNGCALTWNSNANGSLDTHLNDAAFAGSAWLRIVRTGNSFVGSCSDDGTSWTTIGIATPAGFDMSVADAGLFSSAVNSGASDRVLAGFSTWGLRAVAAPQAWASIDGRTVSLTAAADSSELSRIEYALGDAPWQIYGGPVTVEGTSAVDVSYRAVDSRGVVGGMSSATVAATDPGAAAVLEALGMAKTVLVGEQTTGLGVRATDGNGGPVLGTTITFTASGGVFAGGGSTATVETNAAGIAVAPAVSSSTPGRVTLTAALGERSVDLPDVTVVAASSAVAADLTASAVTISGKVVIEASAVNTSEETVSIKIVTRYGTKTFATVSPGSSVTAPFKTYLQAVPDGTVTATVTGPSGTATVTARYGTN